VTFNGYDMLDAFDAAGDPITAVFSNLLTTVNVVVQNSGNLFSDPSPNMKSYFLSGGGSVKTFFTPNASGVIDTVTVDLPTEDLSAGDDTLVLVLQSHYTIDDSLYTALDSMVIPVTVSIPSTFDLADESFKPDSAYAGSGFDISFQVVTSAFPGPIDSTGVTVRLYTDTTGEALATIFEGGPEPTGFENDTIIYAGLTAIIDTAAALLPGWYVVRLDYHLVSGEDVFTLKGKYPDSLYIVPPATLSYAEASLLPASVPQGSKVAFTFDLMLDEEQLLDVDSLTAHFTVNGGSFSTTTNLRVPSNRLVLGVNTISTDSVFIPSDELGNDLSFIASFDYRIPGLPNQMTFVTDLNGESVPVIELPLVQILDVRAQAPNRPRVNTSQPFRIRCEIANLSTSITQAFPLWLTSDGVSIFDSVVQVDPINPLDTVVYFFEATAADEPTAAELFRVEIRVQDPDQIPAIDDVAIVTIEEPASLSLSVTLPGAESGYVERGGSFQLIAALSNGGQAQVSAGLFRLTSHGVDLGVDDPLTDTFRVGEPYTISFVAPDEDATFTLSFVLIDLPIDLNDTLPAEIADTSFETTVRVASLDADLFATAESPTSNLVLPGGEKELFRLHLTNRGSLDVSEMQIRTVTLSFSDVSGEPLEVRSILSIGNSGFYRDGVKISTASAGQDKMVASFSDLTLPPGSMVSLVFRAVIQEGAANEFRINVERDAIQAVFTSGPNAGQSADVEAPEGETTVFEDTYTPAEGLSAQASFVIKDNPFNPLIEPAEFQVYLPEPGEVEFRVFTLTGEEVYEKSYAAGELVPSPGDPFVTIRWNGQNDRGNRVLNGVYIALLRIVQSGDEALLKIAVVK